MPPAERPVAIVPDTQRQEASAKQLPSHLGRCRSPFCCPEFTVLCRGTICIWIWFLLQRGQLHLSRQTQASAGLSTGVLPVRGTPGEVRSIHLRIQVTVHDQATSYPWMAAVERAVCQGQILIDPATAATRLRGGVPALRQHYPTAIPGRLVEQLALELVEP